MHYFETTTMKQYSKTELAKIIQDIIIEKYSVPAKLYEDLKSNFNRKIKIIVKKDMTPDELKSKGMVAATNFSKTINQIPLNYIENKISEEIVNMGIKGFDIKDYKDYFLKAAKDRVNEFINVKYKVAKKGKR